MTHLPYDEQRESGRLADIVARDEAHPSLGRQVLNGLGGLMVLLVTGVLIMLIVLWKSP